MGCALCFPGKGVLAQGILPGVPHEWVQLPGVRLAGKQAGWQAGAGHNGSIFDDITCLLVKKYTRQEGPYSAP